ncbi:unnamed protein product [Menidia menidia]|uniref:(Atlantic silverside) hypothetical protein n=1 Tax=Menidia menidia TaxID=238744 RepID=A0A8S4B1Y6_9TELE|nr:unnamed protein product [Menidia menidia]
MTDPERAAGTSASPPGTSAGGPPGGDRGPPWGGGGLPGRPRALCSTQPGRLPSLRTRDLTLGGALKKPKKSFEPNVHAERKSKDELKEEIPVAPKKEKKQRDEWKRENRTRRKERPKVIQSHSIFEQAPADSELKAGWPGAKGLYGLTSSPVCRPVKEERREWKKDEDLLLSKLQRDDFLDDPDLRSDARFKPIQLPLSQSSGFPDTQTPSATTSGQSPRPSRSCGGQRAPELVRLLQELRLSGGEELFFIQLPDCMPGPGSGPGSGLWGEPGPGSASEKLGKKKGKFSDKSSTRLQTPEAVVEGAGLGLSQFPEGRLGKLQIRKSGKMELKLGDIVMDVSEGAAFSFLQQLVSVHLSDGRTGSMMVLGNVHHKLVLSPDFQVLLSQAATQEPKGP